MKLQQLIYKVEELRALVSMYEQSQKALAQAVAVKDTMGDEADAEQQQSVHDAVANLEARLARAGELLVSRTSAADVDMAVERVQEHISRLQQYQEVRGEQLQLRTQLDLEMELGGLTPEVRQQAESTLQTLQTRLDALVKQGHDALPGPRLITV